MRKLLLSLALAASALTMVAVPAQAQSQRVPRCDVGTDYRFDADQAELRIRGLGLNVKTVPKVEEWNNCFRAYILNPDGSEAVSYFDPTSLRWVGGDIPEVWR